MESITNKDFIELKCRIIWITILDDKNLTKYREVLAQNSQDQNHDETSD